MSSTDVSLDPMPRPNRPPDPPGAQPGAGPPPTLHEGRPAGLRSLQGIRWLLLVGGLVVAVSVIRLVAAEWQQLSAVSQFGVLVLGALGIFAVADVVRHRLHLPLAGSALHALFVALVPLLAWGAAHQRLVMGWGGALVVALGIGALVGACRRLLRKELGYGELPYTIVLGGLLGVMPFLGMFSDLLGVHEFLYILIAAVAGGAMRWGSCHINRFLFHRDRRDGVERPVHLLPFALLLTVYGAAMASMSAAAGWLAVPLAFAAWALIDSGEEYYRALIQATGEPITRWPPRSVLLLILGFACLAVSLGLAPGVGWIRGWAVVSTLATLRLLMWGLRYRSAVAYGSGLLSGVMAYHAIPALIPGLAKDIYRLLLDSLGLAQGSVGVLGLADVGLLALLIASAVGWRRQLSQRMMQVHLALIALHATLVLAAAWSEPQALRWVALLMCPLMAWAATALRRHEFLPWVYGALASAALAWGWQTWSPTLWTERGTFFLLLANLLYLAAARVLLHRLDRRRAAAAGIAERTMRGRLLVLPVLVTTLGGTFFAATFALHTFSALLLLSAACFALSAVHLRLPPLGMLTAVTASMGILGWVSYLWPEGWILAIAAQTLLLGAWAVERIKSKATTSAGAPASPQADVATALWRWTMAAGVWFNSGVGVVLLIVAFIDQTMTLEATVLLWLGSYLFDRVGRRGAFSRPAGGYPAIDPSARQWLGAALLLLVLYPLAQAMAWGSVSWIGTLSILGVTLAVLSLAVHWRLGDALARLYGCDVDRLRGVVEGRLLRLRHPWQLLAAASCLIWSGSATLALSVLLAAEVLWRCSGRSYSPPPTGERDPSLLLTLLPMLQLAALTVGGGASTYLAATLLDFSGFGPLVLIAALWLWCLGMNRLSARAVAVPTMAMWVAETAAALCVLIGLVAMDAVDGAIQLRHIAFAASALAFALWNLRRAWTGGQSVVAWTGHAWLVLAVSHGCAVGGWIFEAPINALWLLAVAVALESFAGWVRRATGLDQGCQRALIHGSQGAATFWALVASAVSLSAGFGIGKPWLSIAPAVLASVFFALRARRGEWVMPSAALASGLFTVAFSLAVHRLPFLGPEMYFMGPGIALIALSWLLEPRISSVARGRLLTWGVVAVYGTPMMGLMAELGWMWQISMLLTAIAFGALSFRLRSRSVLTVSTAALIVDLLFFVIKLRRTEPTLLWVGGIAFGLALMGGAAYLEHRREEVEQRLRIWGRELKSWS